MLSSTTASSGDDPESWLAKALAELDRAWGPTGPGGEAGQHTETPPDQPAAAAEEPCTVVIDVARDGRRFAGPRAGAVVRAAADRLTDRLPQGARLKLGESDALSISSAGWDRAAATQWMHRTLPGILEGFDAGEDLPSAQLRAAVHDSDGPVGAQILQSLERPAGRRHATGANRPDAAGGSFDRPDTGRSGRRRADDRTPERDLHDWLRESTGSVGRHGSGRDTGGHRPDAGNGSAAGAANGAAAATGNGGERAADVEPAARADRGGRVPAESGGGRAAAGESERGPERATTSERDTERGGTASSASSTAGGTAAGSTSGGSTSGEAAAEPAEPTGSTEGLGIADLLAGALDAYRAI
jgi:hypothetical protein